jgi:hypothetical protein
VIGTVAAVPTGYSLALGRTTAVLAGASAVLHVLLVNPASLASLVSVVLALGCLPCARQLWRSPTGAAWATTAVLDATMLAVHLTDQAGAHTAHATHGPGGLAGVALAGMVAQLLLAGVASLRR